MNSYPYEENVDLIIRYIPQECEGNYCEYNSEWNRSMKRKVKYIIEYLEDLKDGEFLVHVDIDVVFYRAFRDDMSMLMNKTGCDILFQDDGNGLCMGFFVARKSEELLILFKTVYERMDQFAHDQDAMNKLLPTAGVRYGKLPHRYYSFGTLNGLQRWEPGFPRALVPDDIIAHHANWTVGVENKLKLIQHVKEIVRA